MKKAIVLLNMWASRNKNEFKEFLQNMFFDKYILWIKNKFIRKIIWFFIVRSILKTSWQHFEKIWWKSPMYILTEKLVKILKPKFPDFFITYSMRYTKPFSSEILKEIRQKNIDEIILVPLYPHTSTSTNISSIENFLQAIDNKFEIKKAYWNFNEILEEIDKFDFKNLKIVIIKSFYDNKVYNNIIIENIKKKLKNNYLEYSLIFSAHSLPERIIKLWDKYKEEIEKNINILKTKLIEENIIFQNIELAYQSKVDKEKWLEPSLWETLKKYSWKKIIIYPISFIIDNSETTYELDIEYKELAEKYWIIEYLRVECINDNFYEILKDLMK